MNVYTRAILMLVAANFLLALWLLLTHQNEALSKTEVSVVELVHKREAGRLSERQMHTILSQDTEASNIQIVNDFGAESAEAMLCLEVGGSDGLAQFSKLLDSLPLEYNVEQLQVLDMENPFYRVKTAPYESRDVAVVSLASIRESIERSGVPIDSYIVPTGPLENAISLGLFSDQSNALNVQRALAEQDINVLVEQEGRPTSRYRIVLRTDYYIDFKEQIDPLIDALTLQFSAVENVCETIAHAE